MNIQRALQQLGETDLSIVCVLWRLKGASQVHYTERDRGNDSIRLLHYLNYEALPRPNEGLAWLWMAL